MRRSGRTAPARGLFIASLLLSTAALCEPVQAQRVYFHSAAEEKASNQVKDGIDAAKKAHLEAIDAHKTALVAAVEKERQLIARRELAARDAMITEILEQQDDVPFDRNIPAEELDKLKKMADNRDAELKAEIYGRLNKVLGLNEKETDLFLDKSPARLRFFANQKNSYNREVLTLIDSRDRLQKAFEAAGGRGQACDNRGTLNSVAPVAPDERSGDILEAINSQCSSISQAVANDASAIARLEPEAQALLSDDLTVIGRTRGELARASRESVNLSTLVEAQDRLSKAAKDHLAALEKFHRCEQARAKEPGGSERVQKAAKQIEDFTAWLANLDGKQLLDELPGAAAPAPAPRGAAAADSCKTTVGGKEETAAKPTKIASTADLAAYAGITADLQSAAKVAGPLDPARSITAAIREGAEEFKASQLSEIVAAFARPDDPAQTDKAKAAAAMLRIIDNLGKLQQIKNGELPDTSAVLVRLAGARMKAATAALEAERLRNVRDLMQLKVAALREEALNLVDAAQLLRTKDGFDRALMKYSDGWSRGRMPARVIDTEIKNMDYLTWADRERITVEASYAVLEPAAQELQTYGSGGIKAGDIAGYLRTLGIGAIALGGE
jgi:hypothetical protein